MKTPTDLSISKATETPPSKGEERGERGCGATDHNTECRTVCLQSCLQNNGTMKESETALPRTKETARKKKRSFLGHWCLHGDNQIFSLFCTQYDSPCLIQLNITRHYRWTQVVKKQHAKPNKVKMPYGKTSTAQPAHTLTHTNTNTHRDHSSFQNISSFLAFGVK